MYIYIYIMGHNIYIYGNLIYNRNDHDGNDPNI